VRTVPVVLVADNGNPMSETQVHLAYRSANDTRGLVHMLYVVERSRHVPLDAPLSLMSTRTSTPCSTGWSGLLHQHLTAGLVADLVGAPTPRPSARPDGRLVAHPAPGGHRPCLQCRGHVAP
jgi:hypothetical protein